MLVIWEEYVFVVPEEDSTVLAAQELGEHLGEEVTASVGGGYLIGEEPAEFRRTTMVTTEVRCLGPTLWNR